MRFFTLALTAALSMVTVQSWAASPERTASPGDDPFIAYGSTMAEVLRLGGCSQFYENHGDKGSAQLFDQFAAQVSRNPDVVLILTRFKPWIAREIAAQGKPNPEEAANFTERMMRDKAKNDLAQSLIRDEAGFQRTCDIIRSHSSRSDIPLSNINNRFPATILMLRSVR